MGRDGHLTKALDALDRCDALLREAAGELELDDHRALDPQNPLDIAECGSPDCSACAVVGKIRAIAP